MLSGQRLVAKEADQPTNKADYEGEAGIVTEADGVMSSC